MFWKAVNIILWFSTILENIINDIYSRLKYYFYHQNAKWFLLPFKNGNFSNIAIELERTTIIAIAIVGRAITLERKPSKKKQRTDTKKNAKRIKGYNFTRSNGKSLILLSQYWKNEWLDGTLIISYFSGSNNIFADCNSLITNIKKTTSELGSLKLSDFGASGTNSNVFQNGYVAAGGGVFLSWIFK